MFVGTHNPNHKGNVAELAIAKEAAELGLSVLKPLTEHERYDLALGINGRLLRVQCKWASRKGDVIYVRLKSARYSPTRGYVVATYDRSEIDAVAVYCGDLGRCYLLPIDLVAGCGVICLRLRRTRNNQRAALNWAAEYEFRGAVAQLAERVDGIDEAGGSNPPSSTNHGPSSASTSEEVGAHEFRNHFGYYMERAAAGTEILVSRRGKPYARLSAAELPV
jgi:prevent-host-death family protein